MSEEQLTLGERLWQQDVPAGNELLAQYELYVGTTKETSDRRLQMHAFFLTLHTAAIAGLVAIVTTFPSIRIW